MNLTRILLAAAGGFAAYFILGFVMMAGPSARSEFLKYPSVYRPVEAMKSVMPIGMAAMFVAILSLAALYAWLNPAGSGLAAGARFGALIGVFSIGSFVVHNYVNLNIGWKLTLEQSIAYFVEWVAVGITFGLIYRPAP
ncbi:MAG: hypothetical protein WBE72_04505 [Terracidiphilus sp.]